MSWLFAVGVAVGMADDSDGTAGLAGLVSMYMITTLLSPGAVAGITGHEAAPAFGKIVNQFVGILSGLIGSACYNKYKTVKLPDALAFFSGKRAVAIFTAIYSIVAALVLFVVWPLVYGGLVALGEAFIGMGAVGAGIYAFFNRLLIPFGLHHALNSVFWFDVAGISDLSNFWGNTGVYGQTGMYMTGFFPFMMFGLPAACIAMYQTANLVRRNCLRTFSFRSVLFFLYRCYRTNRVFLYVPCSGTVCSTCSVSRYYSRYHRCPADPCRLLLLRRCC